MSGDRGAACKIDHLDGCPPPEMWYRMRIMGENLDRLARIIGSRLAPTIEQAAASLNALLRAWKTRTPA